MKRVVSYLMSIFIFLSVNVAFISCAADKNALSGENSIDNTGDLTMIYGDNTSEASEEQISSETGSSETGRSIDIYIIAGQSNAAGYTPVNTETVSKLWDKALTGVPSVISAGSANSSSGTATISNSYGWERAKAGQGRSRVHMGVEVGMAAALYDGFYSTGSGEKAGFIKYAHGGTSIFNNTSGENACEGNWVSPSYADYLKVEYTGLTGGLYRNLLEQVRMRLAELEDIGYENIRIKGVFWMQGESDRNHPGEYIRAFRYFLSDLRRDLGALTGEDLSSLPVIIGQISRTFAGADASSIEINETFIRAQNRIAETMDNVYTVESGQCDITYWDETTGTSKSYGSDIYHWNQENIFRIGEMVGRCIIDNILNK